MSIWKRHLALDSGAQDILGVGGAAAASGSMVASIQFVEIALAAASASGTDTITAVDTDMTAIFPAGVKSDGTSAQIDKTQCKLTLTNATTVTAERGDSTTFNITVAAWVVEFSSDYVEAVEHVDIDLTSELTDTATLTGSFPLTRSLLVMQGQLLDSPIASYLAGVELTDANTVTATRKNSGAGNTQVSAAAIRFKEIAVNAAVQGSFSTSLSGDWTDTITAVDTTKTLFSYNGFIHNTGDNTQDDCFAGVELTNGTTITAEHDSGSTNDRTAYYSLIEFAEGVPFFAGNLTDIDGSYTGVTKDITLVPAPIDTDKAMTTYGSGSTNSSSLVADHFYSLFKFFDASTFRGERAADGNASSTAHKNRLNFFP